MSLLTIAPGPGAATGLPASSTPPTGGYLHLPCESLSALTLWMQGKPLKASARDLCPERLLLGRRLVVQTTFRGLPVLADMLTGVLYDPRTGRCLSSSRLHLDVAALVEVSQDQAKAWLHQRERALRDAKK
ncbi:MAG: hypothetical protein ACYCSN_17260 [Acidobacteriaceae bacterium]